MRQLPFQKMLLSGIMGLTLLAFTACGGGSDDTSAPTSTPVGTSPSPTADLELSPTTEASPTVEGEETPESTSTPLATNTAEASPTAEAEDTPEATTTPVATVTAEASPAPKLEETPEATATPVATETSEATATALPTATPEATTTPEASPEPYPTPSGVRQLSVSASDQLAFDPAEIQARAGETIEFEVKNDGQLFHTFTIALTTSKDEMFVDLPLQAGQTKTAELTIPEDVQSLYLYCKPHESSGMTGMIHVDEDG